MTWMNAVITHVWQSTLFAAVVALLTLALRKNQAHWRCRLWVAASVKFLIPFSVMARLGSQLGKAPRLAWAGVALFAEDIDIAIMPRMAHRIAMKTSLPDPAVSLPALLLALWAAGFAVALLRWWLNWRQIYAAVRAAAPAREGREVAALRRVQQAAGLRTPLRLLISPGRLEPGIFGIFRLALLWPAEISDRLADTQMEAIMAHEVCHVRRRDNLIAALHKLVEAFFWFHPLVWWLGARLVDEREKACDEEVLRMGSEPETYAESILKTCQFYLESPRLCMAGVTGSDLKQRIERIMSRRIGRRLDFGRKLLLAAAGIAAIAGPILFGVATAPAVRAQSKTATSTGAPPAFEVASIKPNNSDDHRVMFQITPGGRVNLTNVSPKMLIIMAYNLKPNQLTGGPNWFDSVKYDITAKGEGPDSPDTMKLMMQTLLADRFKLAIHRETKEMPIYELVAAKSGPKLHVSPESAGQHKGQFMIGMGQLNLTGATMAEFADSISRVVGRNVYDHTGITGTYDVKVEWTPDESEMAMMKEHTGGKEEGGPAPPEPGGPSLFAALQEQVGLKLESAKGPVEIVVVDHIEKASEN